jgi:xylulokinase
LAWPTDPGKLADLVPSGTIVGEVTASIAEDLGLPSGVLVVSGGYDQACAALGAGVLEEGAAGLCTGSVEAALVAKSGLPDLEPLRARNLSLLCHTVPGLFLVMGWSFAAGTLLRWYRDVMGTDERLLAETLGCDVFQ